MSQIEYDHVVGCPTRQESLSRLASDGQDFAVLTHKKDGDQIVLQLITNYFGTRSIMDLGSTWGNITVQNIDSEKPAHTATLDQKTLAKRLTKASNVTTELEIIQAEVRRLASSFAHTLVADLVCDDDLADRLAHTIINLHATGDIQAQTDRHTHIQLTDINLLTTQPGKAKIEWTVPTADKLGTVKVRLTDNGIEYYQKGLLAGGKWEKFDSPEAKNDFIRTIMNQSHAIPLSEQTSCILTTSGFHTVFQPEYPEDYQVLDMYVEPTMKVIEDSRGVYYFSRREFCQHFKGGQTFVRHANTENALCTLYQTFGIDCENFWYQTAIKNPGKSKEAVSITHCGPSPDGIYEIHCKVKGGNDIAITVENNCTYVWEYNPHTGMYVLCHEDMFPYALAQKLMTSPNFSLSKAQFRKLIRHHAGTTKEKLNITSPSQDNKEDEAEPITVPTISPDFAFAF